MAKIAAVEGISRSAVDGRLKRLGIKVQRRLDIDRFVIKYHSRGLNDRQIAAAISDELDREVYATAVKRRRTRLGLGSNFDLEEHRRTRPAAMRAALDRMGVTGAELRSNRMKEQSVRLGWPPVKPSWRRYLEAVEEERIASADTIAVRLKSVSTRSLAGYLRKLRRAGYVEAHIEGGVFLWQLSKSLAAHRERWKIESRQNVE